MSSHLKTFLTILLFDRMPFHSNITIKAGCFVFFRLFVQVSLHFSHLPYTILHILLTFFG